jgi:predicted nuclease with TOPRIM domain
MTGTINMSENTENNEKAVDVDVEAVENLLEKGLNASIKSTQADEENKETLGLLIKSVTVIGEKLDQLTFGDIKEDIAEIKKSLDSLKEQEKNLQNTLDTLKERDDELQKSLKIIEETPIKKAVLSVAETAPASEESVETWTKEEVLTKSLHLLQGSISSERKYQLRQEIAKLDSGFLPSDIALTLGLNR